MVLVSIVKIYFLSCWHLKEFIIYLYIYCFQKRVYCHDHSTILTGLCSDNMSSELMSGLSSLTITFIFLFCLRKRGIVMIIQPFWLDYVQITYVEQTNKCLIEPYIHFYFFYSVTTRGLWSVLYHYALWCKDLDKTSELKLLFSRLMLDYFLSCRVFMRTLYSSI